MATRRGCTLRQVHDAHADAGHQVRHPIIPDGIFWQPVQDWQGAHDAALQLWNAASGEEPKRSEVKVVLDCLMKKQHESPASLRSLFWFRGPWMKTGTSVFALTLPPNKSRKESKIPRQCSYLKESFQRWVRAVWLSEWVLLCAISCSLSSSSTSRSTLYLEYLRKGSISFFNERNLKPCKFQPLVFNHLLFSPPAAGQL